MGQFDHKHFRNLGTNLLALDWIVIHECQRFDTDVQFGSNLAQILRLVTPVDAHRREVLRLEQHAGMVLQRFHGIVSIVLAADCEQNASMMEIEQRALKVLICATRMLAAELNSGNSVLPDHSSPKSVIEVHNYSLRNFTGKRV